jgi:hypothetical protein
MHCVAESKRIARILIRKTKEIKHLSSIEIEDRLEIGL